MFHCNNIADFGKCHGSFLPLNICLYHSLCIVFCSTVPFCTSPPLQCNMSVTYVCESISSHVLLMADVYCGKTQAAIEFQISNILSSFTRIGDKFKCCHQHPWTILQLPCHKQIDNKPIKSHFCCPDIKALAYHGNLAKSTVNT